MSKKPASSTKASESLKPVTKPIQIDFRDIEAFISTPANAESYLTRCGIGLGKSIFQTPGLKSLQEAISEMSADKPLTAEQMAELRRAHEKTLLEDMEYFSSTSLRPFEKVVKVPSPTKENPSKTKNEYIKLSFKKSFYDELSKPYSERSADFHDFVEVCSKTSTQLFQPETISAKAFLALQQDTSAPLLEVLTKSYKEFSGHGLEQAKKDLGKRAQCMMFIEGTKVTKIQPEKTHLSDNGTFGDLIITGEQSDWIKKYFNQSFFMGNWQTALAGPLLDMNPRMSADRSEIHLEKTVDGRLLASSRGILVTQNSETGSSTPIFEGTITVDITKLEGKSFTLGQASGKVSISLQIDPISDKIQLSLPDSIKTQEIKELLAPKIRQHHVQLIMDELLEQNEQLLRMHQQLQPHLAASKPSSKSTLDSADDQSKRAVAQQEVNRLQTEIAKLETTLKDQVQKLTGLRDSDKLIPEALWSSMQKQQYFQAKLSEIEALEREPQSTRDEERITKLSTDLINHIWLAPSLQQIALSSEYIAVKEVELLSKHLFKENMYGHCQMRVANYMKSLQEKVLDSSDPQKSHTEMTKEVDSFINRLAIAYGSQTSEDETERSKATKEFREILQHGVKIPDLETLRRERLKLKPAALLETKSPPKSFLERAKDKAREIGKSLDTVSQNRSRASTSSGSKTPPPSRSSTPSPSKPPLSKSSSKNASDSRVR